MYLLSYLTKRCTSAQETHTSSTEAPHHVCSMFSGSAHSGQGWSKIRVCARDTACGGHTRLRLSGPGLRRMRPPRARQMLYRPDRTDTSRCSIRGSAILTRGKRLQVEHTRAHVRTLLRAESGCSLRVIRVPLHAELRPADRVIDYGRARAALCKRFEHRAIGHVRAAHGVETQPAHMRMVSMLAHADGMPVLDPPAVHPT